MYPETKSKYVEISYSNRRKEKKKIIDVNKVRLFIVLPLMNLDINHVIDKKTKLKSDLKELT